MTNSMSAPVLDDGPAASRLRLVCLLASTVPGLLSFVGNLVVPFFVVTFAGEDLMVVVAAGHIIGMVAGLLSLPFAVASIALTWLWWRRLGSRGRFCSVMAVVVALVGTAFVPVRLMMLLPAPNWGR